MRNRSTSAGPSWWLVLEAATGGLAGAAGLCWVGVCLLASFRPRELSAPYWRGLPGLRSDTCGVLAFFVLAVCLCTSEYLRLRRRRDGLAAGHQVAGGHQVAAGATAKPLALAVSETVALLAAGLTVYLSVNAVTHPVTLDVRATHLTDWPTEGTLRVAALLLCACSVTVLRYLLAQTSRTGRRLP